ncbi:hypothetical protein ACSBR2_033785 [Camellia fascicularis]
MVLDTVFLLRELSFATLIILITHIFIRSILSKPFRKVPPLKQIQEMKKSQRTDICLFINHHNPLHIYQDHIHPIGLPLIGAIPHLGSMPHVALAKMAKIYGPIVYLKKGTCGMVVASTPDSARAFLKTLDLNFSNRPPNAGATHLAYGAQDMVFADYGPRWKLLRKLSNLHMLGGKALQN